MQQLEFNLGTHFLPDIAEIKGSHQGLYPDPFRLKRVWDKIAQKPFHYSAPGSHIKLGIGEAQLASTVYWLVVFKLAQYQHNHLVPTERGRWLLEKFDPYLQDAQTPWLLHYWGLEPPCFMPSWWWLFNCLNHREFEEDDLRTKLAEFLQRQTDRKNPTATAHNDLRLLLALYQPTGQYSVGQINLLSINLIYSTQIEYFKRSGRTGFYNQYKFKFNQRSVPTQWVLLATAEYAARKQTDQIPLAQLAYKPNSPGQIFKLGEDAIANHLEQAEGIELAFDTNNRLQAKISDSFQHSSNGIPNFC